MTAYLVLRFGDQDASARFAERALRSDVFGDLDDPGEIGETLTQEPHIVGQRGELEVDLKVRFA